MPIQLAVPIEKDYTLDKSDELYNTAKGEPTRVTIRQATQGDHERRAALFSSIVREMARNSTDGDTVRWIQRFSFEELKRIEVFLTLKACNISGSNGKSLFDFDSNGKIQEAKFKQAWDILPPAVAQEIHDCVLELNVDWQPQLGE
ncbi:hypothetical protein MUP59_07395 [Candidatus Bathyarchaeota archaeon]|nr:hypothetical protein [Candidatus Bathyarchaeota archaeon]